MRILIVDDEPSLRAVLSQLLSEDGHQVVEAASGEDALEEFRKEKFQLVITDLKMDGMSGNDLLKSIKEISPDTQFIIITSYASLDTAIIALRAGAYDYLTRPFDDIDIVSTVVNRVVEKIGLLTKKRHLITSLEKKNEELAKANNFLKELSIRDSLTGLNNHRYFQEALSIEIIRSRRYEHHFSLIMIDIDHFKKYNDTYGHPAGDVLLKEISNIFKERIRKSDLAARYGGEEFVLILPETSKQNAISVAENIREQVEQHVFSGSNAQPESRVTVSIGVAGFPEDGDNASALIKYADDSLYKAKAQGRNTLCS
ncbi:MAG: diguanylate cyclase [Nitrospirota bacterium]|nr:MAG: diguanylate cyclase [Nitrospirota bacterium]